MTIKDIELAVASILKGLKDNQGAPLFQICKVYTGEFKGSIDFPEDYRPGQTYALVKVLRRVRPSTGGHILKDGELVVFVGSNTRTLDIAGDDVKYRMPLVEEALDGKRVTFDSTTAWIELQWSEENEEFSVPNNVCWSMSFTLRGTK